MPATNYRYEVLLFCHTHHREMNVHLSSPLVSVSAALQPPTISQRETCRWRVDHLRAYEEMNDKEILEYQFHYASAGYWKRVTENVSNTESKGQQCEKVVSRP